MTGKMDKADALAKKKGYIGIWSMPRELREKIIAEANKPEERNG